MQAEKENERKKKKEEKQVGVSGIEDDRFNIDGWWWFEVNFSFLLQSKKLTDG